MINGNSVTFQLAKETTYGTAVEGTSQVRISSESLKGTYNKVNEGVATGGRGEAADTTMSMSAGGSVSCLGRPDDIGLILKALLGKETVASESGAFKHTFTACDVSDSLPSLTAYVNRVAAKYAYAGTKINSVAFSCAPEDYLKLDVELVAKNEAKVTSMASLTPSALKAFRFKGASISVGGTAVADVTNISLNYNNNLDATTQTTSTGLYYKEPECGTRSITAQIECLYSSDSDALKALADSTDSTFAFVAKFESDQEAADGVKYALTMTIPVCQCTDADANMGGLETLHQNMSFKAVDNLTDELIEFELINATEGAY